MLNNLVFKIIKKAISDKDRGLFFIADYNKQAINVIHNLEKNGYRIVKYEPTESMIDEGVKTISMGTNNSRELVEKIYQAMISEE
jgi:hypothetical protein